MPTKNDTQIPHTSSEMKYEEACNLFKTMLLDSQADEKQLAKNFTKIVSQKYSKKFEEMDKDLAEYFTKHPYYFMLRKANLEYGNTAKLYIIAKSNVEHSKLTVFFNPEKKEQITAKHIPGEYSGSNYANFTIYIELNEKNLLALKALFNFDVKNEEKTYESIFEKIEKEWQLYLTKLAQEVAFKQSLEKQLKNAAQIFPTMESLLQELKESNTSLGLFSYEGNTTQSNYQEISAIISNMRTLFLVIEQNDLNAYKKFFGYNNIKRIQEINDGKIIIGIDIHSLTYPLVEITSEFTLLLNQNRKKSDEIETEYYQQVEQKKQALYQSQFKNTNPENTSIILTIAEIYGDTKFGLQAGIGTPFIQCKTYFLFHDQLTSGLKDRLHELIGKNADKIKFEFDMIEFMLEKMDLYKNGIYYPYKEALPDQSGSLYHAWEFGINFTSNAEQKDLIKFYTHFAGKEFITSVSSENLTTGFLSIPLPNLALFYMMEYIKDKLSVNTHEYNESLKNAIKIIEKFDLIIPKKYQLMIFNSGFLEEDKINYYKLKYEQSYQRQVDLCQEAKHSQDEKLKNAPISTLADELKSSTSTQEEYPSSPIHKKK